jgi:transcription elongation factor Elf1
MEKEEKKEKGESEEMTKKVEKVEEEKGQRFNCGVCGVEWSSKVKRSGVRLCEVCVELRRSLNGFVNRIGLEEVRVRVEKILE